jgi:hypothetical protein
MKKAQILEKILNEFRNDSKEAYLPQRDDADYEKVIVAALEKSLQNVEPDIDIRTCEDFSHLNVKCCECCHGLYQHYEISLIEIENGGSSWICCALDQVLNPIKHANDPHYPEDWTFSEVLTEFERMNENAK